MNGMQQGLGGITAGSMPRMTENAVGATKQSMEQIMEAARKMSDAQLADVLAGKSMEIPQFVAMSEAMGRKQLRTAMQGAQAQQQGQQPSIREQLLAETAAQAAPPIEQGIGALPAPNMEQMEEMAGGGIVAFAGEDGSLVGAPGKEAWEYEVAGETDPEMGSFWDKLGRAFTYSSDVEAMKQRQQQQQDAEIAAQDQALNETPAEIKPVDTTGQGNVTPAAADRRRPAPVVEEAEAPAEEAPNRFAQFQNDGAALEKTLEEQREQTQGEFLMQIGASLLSSPTIAQGLSSGVQKALPMLAVNKRDANKLRQDARDFQFNVAKAQEAAEMGEADLAYKYEALAAEKAYRAGLLATKGADSGLKTKDMLKAFQDAKKAALENPLTAAQYNKMSEAERTAFDQKIYSDVMRTIQAVTGGGMMTQGGLPPSLQQAIEAEYQRRTSGE